MDASADAQRISTNEWMRKAIQEKLDREMTPRPEVLTAEELERVIARILKEKLAEKEWDEVKK